MAAKEAVVDFTNVKDGGTFNKKHITPGDYKAKITKVEDAPSKADNIGQWLFTIQIGAGTYPYYCKHQENQYWKIRNLLIAAGIAVPKKRVKVNPNVLVGKTIAVTVDDEEYKDKMQSVIQATFPVSELGAQADTEDEASDDDDDDDDDEETPAPKKKAPAKPADDDDEDDDEEPAPPPAKKKKPAPAPVDDDDDDDDDTPPPPKKKKPAKVEVDDDELEELDIDDV